MSVPTPPITSQVRRALREGGGSLERGIRAFLREYVRDNGGVARCRHGGCYELVEAFINECPSAQMWETWELGPEEDHLPLVLSFEQVNEVLAASDADGVDDVGGLGGHAVAVLDGVVFDAAGISTFEEITDYFSSLKHVHWIRTA